MIGLRSRANNVPYFVLLKIYSKLRGQVLLLGKEHY
jgi:hypothetical protein